MDWYQITTLIAAALIIGGFSFGFVYERFISDEGADYMGALIAVILMGVGVLLLVVSGIGWAFS